MCQFFSKCFVYVFSFNSYHKPIEGHGLIPIWQMRGSRGLGSSGNFLLWPARPVLRGFCIEESERKGKREKVRVKRERPGGQYWGMWESTPGKKQERRDRFQKRYCGLCISFRLFEKCQDWSWLSLKWQLTLENTGSNHEDPVIYGYFFQ